MLDCHRKEHNFRLLCLTLTVWVRFPLQLDTDGLRRLRDRRGAEELDLGLKLSKLKGPWLCDLREAAEQAGGTTRLRSAGSIQRRQVR